jgi:hypothetical protein
MSTQHPDLFAALAAPFTGRNEVKSRNQSGRKLEYVTARTIMNRLDAVLGPENWWDRYRPGEKSVLCELTIRLPDGRELTKCDAGGYAGMSDDGDDEKSGYSDAFKRAAVKFGVSRYLYGDGVAELHGADQAGDKFAADGSELTVTRAEPERPARRDRRAWGNGQAKAPAAAPLPDDKAAANGLLKDGKAFFGWCRDTGKARGVDILKYLNAWAKRRNYPARIVDWDHDQTAAGYAEVQRKLATIESQEPEYAEVG